MAAHASLEDLMGPEKDNCAVPGEPEDDTWPGGIDYGYEPAPEDPPAPDAEDHGFDADPPTPDAEETLYGYGPDEGPPTPDAEETLYGYGFDTDPTTPGAAWETMRSGAGSHRPIVKSRSLGRRAGQTSSTGASAARRIPWQIRSAESGGRCAHAFEIKTRGVDPPSSQPRRRRDSLPTASRRSHDVDPPSEYPRRSRGVAATRPRPAPRCILNA